MNNNEKSNGKEKLKEKLCRECEIAWATKGYKKTSITYLTSKVGISTGHFYLLYDNKEQLFSETLRGLQSQLKLELEKILSENPNKTGFVAALKWLYREYSKRRYLYDFISDDFQAFINKLSPEEMASLKLDSIEYSEYIIEKTYLVYKVDKQLVFDTIQALLYTVSIQDSILENKIRTFDFIIEAVIPKLFE